MMRMMPYYFRPEEAGDLDFTCQLVLGGPGGGTWVLRVADRRCNVRPGSVQDPDLTVRCDGRVFLGIHRGEVNPVWQLLTGGIRLAGRRGLFLAFPRLFPVSPAEGSIRRWIWQLRLAAAKWTSRRSSRTQALQ